MLVGNVGRGSHPSWALAGAGDSMSSHPGHCTTPSPGRLPQEILTSPEMWWPQARGHKQEPHGLFFVLHPANLPGLWLKKFFWLQYTLRSGLSHGLENLNLRVQNVPNDSDEDSHFQDQGSHRS